jgi:hypothetical protein
VEVGEVKVGTLSFTVKPIDKPVEGPDGKSKLADVLFYVRDAGIKIRGAAVWRNGAAAKTQGISVSLPATPSKSEAGRYFEFFTTIETNSKDLRNLKDAVKAEYERLVGMGAVPAKSRKQAAA